jgi:hypothetical protein
VNPEKTVRVEMKRKERKRSMLGWVQRVKEFEGQLLYVGNLMMKVKQRIRVAMRWVEGSEGWRGRRGRTEKNEVLFVCCFLFVSKLFWKIAV